MADSRQPFEDVINQERERKAAAEEAARQQALEQEQARAASAEHARLAAEQREQHLRELNAIMHQDAARVANAALRTGLPQDARVGRFLPRAIGWYLASYWHVIETKMGGYENLTQYTTRVDATVLAPTGVLYNLSASIDGSDALDTDHARHVLKASSPEELRLDSETSLAHVQMITRTYPWTPEAIAEANLAVVRPLLARFAIAHSLDV